MELTAQISAVVGLVVAIIGIIKYAYNKAYYEKVRIKRITCTKDRDIDQFMVIYMDAFPIEARDSVDNIRKWICDCEDSLCSKCRTYEDYFLIAKFRNEVLGFLYATFHYDDSFMFVSYWAAAQKEKRGDNLPAETKAASKLVDKLIAIAKNKHPDCKAIVFEVYNPSDKLTESENKKREVLMRYYRQYSHMVHLNHDVKIKKMEFDYILPKSSISKPTFQEDHLTLYYIPMHSGREELVSLHKNEVIELLAFIYFKIYAQCLEAETPIEIFEYNEYLAALGLRVSKNLPDEIALLEHAEKG